MAWCIHCKQDRPIQRQTYDGNCTYCGMLSSSQLTYNHQDGCRGPVAGALDVCSYCNTPLFAKAQSQQQYEQLARIESRIDRNKKVSACFVVTATMGNAEHPIVYHMSYFRDKILRHYNLGNKFIESYYQFGPKIAQIIRNKFYLRLISLVFLIMPSYLCVRFINKIYKFFTIQE